MSGSPSPLPRAHLRETLPGVRTRRGRDLVHLSIKCYLSDVISLPCIGPTTNTHSYVSFPEIRGLMFTLPFSRWGETHTKTNSDATPGNWWIYSLQNYCQVADWSERAFYSSSRESKPPRPELRAHSMLSLKEGNSPQENDKATVCWLCTKRAFLLGVLAPSNFSQKQATEPKLLFWGWFVDVRKGEGQMPHVNFMASLNHHVVQIYFGK